MTIFFCLILLMISALICTCLESARTAGLRFMAKTASDSALQSMFADYHSELWEKYHVFFHCEKREDMANTLNTYLSYYEDPEKELYLQDEYTDMWDLSVDGVTVLETKTAADDGGRLFLEQAVAFEQYQIGKSLLESLLERMDLLDEINRVREFAVRISDAFELVQTVSGLYQDVRDTVKTVTVLADQINVLLTGEEKRPEAVYEGLKRLTDQVGRLVDLSGKYLKSAEKVGDLTSELTREFGDSEETIYGQQIRQIKAFALEGLFGSAVGSVVSEAEGFWIQLCGLTEEFKGFLSEENGEEERDEAGEEDGEERDESEAGEAESAGSDESRKDREEQLAEWFEQLGKTVESGTALMESLTNRLDQADKDSSDEEAENDGTEEGDAEGFPEAGAESQDLLDMVKQWKNMAVLSLVMGEEAMETRADQFDDLSLLPSETVQGELQNVSLAEKGLFVFYIADTFTDGLSRTQGEFAYQQEYILFGKADSRSNLTAMAERLLAVREGLNLAFLLTNTRMRMMAESAAYALVGATGLYPVILITQFLLLAAWAFAESVADVRELFAGESVPLWKTESDWKTSIGGLTLSDERISGTDHSFGIDLSYQDYLKMFLLVKDTQTLCLRSMDIIQNEIGTKEKDFLMADCYGAATVSVGFSSPYRLITVPLVGETSGLGHRINVLSAYEYQ